MKLNYMKVQQKKCFCILSQIACKEQLGCPELEVRVRLILLRRIRYS